MMIMTIAMLLMIMVNMVESEYSSIAFGHRVKPALSTELGFIVFISLERNRACFVAKVMASASSGIGT